jgi:hypothetical protein
LLIKLGVILLTVSWRVIILVLRSIFKIIEVLRIQETLKALEVIKAIRIGRVVRVILIFISSAVP